jgi:electron transport complex protein RnfA
MGDYFVLVISSIFINNILLAQYLGNCPFLGTSKKMETAIGMGMAVIFVLVMAGTITWITNTYFLVKLDLEYLRTVAFILVIASLVQFVEMFLKKSIPALYAGLGIFLPLITTNCAVMGVCLILVNEEYNFIRSGINSICRGSRTHPFGPGSQTVARHLHRPGNRRNPVAHLFRLQGDGLTLKFLAAGRWLLVNCLWELAPCFKAQGISISDFGLRILDRTSK